MSRLVGAARSSRGVAVLLLLLAAAHVSDVVAQRSILWRSLAVSWDSAATQLQDEAASQGAPYSDASAEARSAAVLVAPSGCVALRRVAAVPFAPARSFWLSRAPPPAAPSPAI